MLSFWDTMLGQRLAETLNRELPRLNRKKEQYTKLIKEEQAVAYIETEITAGNRFISHVKDAETGYVLIIMEKGERDYV